MPYYLYCLRLRRLVLIFVNPLYNRSRKGRESALARFKTRIAFADDVNFAPASDDLAVAVALFGGFE
uniref:Uncharacterized protein n=1 Tax=Neisseria meningitidis alpha275 TaxID=295996 RepID=C6SHL5_NEIME|nr:hypothetical protein predicted by Glimmer/Critica [Neisseria meningitidis alpha275]